MTVKHLLGNKFSKLVEEKRKENTTIPFSEAFQSVKNEIILGTLSLTLTHQNEDVTNKEEPIIIHHDTQISYTLSDPSNVVKDITVTTDTSYYITTELSDGTIDINVNNDYGLTEVSMNLDTNEFGSLTYSTYINYIPEKPIIKFTYNSDYTASEIEDNVYLESNSNKIVYFYPTNSNGYYGYIYDSSCYVEVEHSSDNIITAELKEINNNCYGYMQITAGNNVDNIKESKIHIVINQAYYGYYICRTLETYVNPNPIEETLS